MWISESTFLMLVKGTGSLPRCFSTQTRKALLSSSRYAWGQQSLKWLRRCILLLKLAMEAHNVLSGPTSVCVCVCVRVVLPFPACEATTRTYTYTSAERNHNLETLALALDGTTLSWEGTASHSFISNRGGSTCQSRARPTLWINFMPRHLSFASQSHWIKTRTTSSMGSTANLEQNILHLLGASGLNLQRILMLFYLSL